jgi:hypothetical protein
VGHIPSPCSSNRPQPAVCSFPFPFLPSLLLSRRWRSLSLSLSLARSLIAVLLAVSPFEFWLLLWCWTCACMCSAVIFALVPSVLGFRSSGVSWPKRPFGGFWEATGSVLGFALVFFVFSSSSSSFARLVRVIRRNRWTRCCRCCFVRSRDSFVCWLPIQGTCFRVAVVCVTRSVDSGCVLLRFSSCPL